MPVKMTTQQVKRLEKNLQRGGYTRKGKTNKSDAIPIDLLNVMEIMERYLPNPAERWKQLKEYLRIQKAAQQIAQQPCFYCGGSGWKPGTHTGAGVVCGECDGTGQSH